MLSFAISDLRLDETSFQIPSSLGQWVFDRRQDFQNILPQLDQGMIVNTYFASNSSVTIHTSDADFSNVYGELIDICLLLSFLNACCATPSRTAPNSDAQLLQLRDSFIRPRAIRGFTAFQASSMTALFSNWIATTYASYQNRLLRLQLSHWLSGLTCFSLEDLFLSVGVQMDIVKQREIVTTGKNLSYFDGMTSASNRYSISPLGQDYKNMRNDIVHYGMLSGPNFSGKSKAQCASVIADTLNWLDLYILKVLALNPHVLNLPRWQSADLEKYLPAISLH